MSVYTATASSPGSTVGGANFEVTEDGVITSVHLEVYGTAMGILGADVVRAEVGFASSPCWDVSLAKAVLARVHSVASVGISANTQPFQAARSVVLSGLAVPVRVGDRVYLHVAGATAVPAVATVTVVVG